ncbi:phosphorylated adapter RNA export protein-like [Plakobranchus ocellatus]|uniref:Phosphorylated adapter RNA export protein n=1 Tax=Plakobranchus ocellatus TaxID=259542 RepID=A0AAV4E2C7_9GAST|nr:phosphorylated adapter RNA export protein-like [Plakobranchus ocellatus]
MAATREERIDELEDGECSDSDRELQEDQNEQIDRLSQPHDGRSLDEMYRHRTQIPQIVINSDESSDSDDDYPTVHKRSRKPIEGHAPKQSSSFVNPLLSNRPMDRICESGRKRKNNIWSSVISEQVLSHNVKSFGMENPVIQMDERDVESYDFTKAKDDERPNLEVDVNEDNLKDDIFGGVVDLEREVKRHENRKRKRNAKERLGRRTYDKHKLRNLGVTENDDIAAVVKAIADGLAEPKFDLISRIVENVGKAQAIQLYYMTEDIEDAGGMMIKNGSRRRTPGGVYIELLKSDTSISQDIISAIFEEEDKEWKMHLKEKRKMKKAARKKHRRNKAKQMDLDRPESPPQVEDLEVLNVLGSPNDLDASDFPERPATPEPKDDSSDDQAQGDDEEDEEEEDDEDDDISVAIAKAKAAILKKQKELAKKALCDDDKMADETKDRSSVVEQNCTDAGCGGDMAVE